MKNFSQMQTAKRKSRTATTPGKPRLPSSSALKPPGKEGAQIRRRDTGGGYRRGHSNVLVFTKRRGDSTWGNKKKKKNKEAKNRDLIWGASITTVGRITGSYGGGPQDTKRRTTQKGGDYSTEVFPPSRS